MFRHFFQSLCSLSICITKHILFAFILIQVAGCSEKSDQNNPVIKFISDTSYTSVNTTVPIGYPAKIGIDVTGIDAPITNLVVTLTTANGTETAIDTGIYDNQFVFTRVFPYGASSYETWTFTVMDKNRNKASVSLTLSKDSNSLFGPIVTYTDVVLGTQYNISEGNFLSLPAGTTVRANDMEPLAVNLYNSVYYADQAVPPTEYTFSSPNENDAPTYYPQLLDIVDQKNEVNYKPDSITISPAAFMAAYNDSLIITNYTSATNGKRKFKLIRAGYVIPFALNYGPLSGKRGLIYVKSVDTDPSGKVLIDIKMQQ
jgi:hypothetical protein